ncbi:MAG: hypothetical protein ACHQYQ_01875 [Bacteriovoracales bacterium]
MKAIGILIAIVLTGCNVTVDTWTKLDYANEFVDNLSNDPAAFDSFFLEKTYTVRGGGWILVEDDFGEIRAVDIYSLVRDHYSYDLDYFTDYSKPVDYIGGDVWEDYDGHLYEEGVTPKKDVEKIAAGLEKLKVEAMGESFSERFGLSEERGVQVAKLVSNWKKISNIRSLSEKDADAFSQKLLGFNLNSGIKAMDEFNTGNTKSLESLVATAAKTNGVSPEQMNEIISEFMKK